MVDADRRKQLDDLRRLLDSGVAADTDRVPTEEVWAAARGELPPAEAREVAERAARDPDAVLAWRLAVALDNAEAEVSAVPSPPAARRWWRGAVAAAAVVVLALGGVWLLHDPSPPTYRDGAAAAIESLAPATLARDAAVLSWTPVEGAVGYHLVAQDARLRVLHEVHDLERPEHRLPASVLEPLGAGTPLLWRVEARLPDGRVVVSDTFTARLE